MSETLSLADIRQRIDQLDADILSLFNQRAMCALEVAKIKQAAGEVENFYRPEREAGVLRRIKELNSGPLSSEAILQLFRELMSHCLALEKPLRIGFLGPQGAFTEQAAYKHFGRAIDAIALSSIDEIFRAVEQGHCQFGVVPVENSTEGGIAHTLDGFQHSPLLISGEVILPIHHNLLSSEGDLAGVQKVFSHQQSLAQCRQWLMRHLTQVPTIAVSSNAEAARLAMNTPHSAAIAGLAAAEHYDLNVLAANIEDEPDNTTRFLVIGKQPVGKTGQDKTALLVGIRNQSGALYHLLEPFARRDISLSKIESRPSRRGRWDYVFFIDIEGHRDDENLACALAELESQVTLLKILGSYPKAVF